MAAGPYPGPQLTERSSRGKHRRMGETIHDANGITICAQVDGPDDGVPLLLIEGLGTQIVSWDQRLVDALCDRGYLVVRLDNRDAGRSTHFDGSVVDLVAILTDPDAPPPPYLLSDMAADCVGLLDSLELPAAHVVGVSLGGMIGHTLAIEHGDRILSVTSIMSSTGDPDVGQPTPAALDHLLAPAATSEDEAVASALRGTEVWGSPEYPEPEAIAARARREWNRVQYPEGTARQLAAMLASGSRTAALRELTIPFGVIHGLADTLIAPSGGRRTAEAVPGATLIEIEGMGHNLPAPVWPQIIETIVATTVRASQPA